MPNESPNHNRSSLELRIENSKSSPSCLWLTLNHNRSSWSGFPNPDQMVSGSFASVSEKTVYLQERINSVFTPLTEQPVIYKKIQTGYQTENALPFQMVTKYEVNGDWKVRFTDYTLDGASVNHYFYFLKEFNIHPISVW